MLGYKAISITLRCLFFIGRNYLFNLISTQPQKFFASFPGHRLERVLESGRHGDVDAVGRVLHHVRHLVPIGLLIRPELDEELGGPDSTEVKLA